jgi:hypothetical protein
MKRALTEFFAKTLQSQRFVQMLLDKAANRLRSAGLGVSAERFRFAAQAGPISSSLGLFWPGKELDISPAWPARRAGGPAIHSRARDGENEFPIPRGIAGHHGIPAPFVDCGRLS